jgi:hypothetical protein
MTWRSETRFGFLSYEARSGSTYLCALLNSHPTVLVTPEADVPLSALDRGAGWTLGEGELEKYCKLLCESPKLGAWHLDQESVLSLVRRAAEGSSALSTELVFKAMLAAYAKQTGRRVTWIIFKGGVTLPRQSNRQRLKSWDVVLHLVRDPRAVYKSQRAAKHVTARLPLAASPLDYSAKWAGGVTCARQPQAKICLVRFEDIVGDLDHTLSRLWNRLDVTPAEIREADFQEYVGRIPESQRHLHMTLQKEPDEDRLESWKTTLSECEIRAIELTAGLEMISLGYPLSSPGTQTLGRSSRVLWRLRALIHRVWYRLDKERHWLRSSTRLRLRMLAVVRGWSVG